MYILVPENLVKMILMQDFCRRGLKSCTSKELPGNADADMKHILSRKDLETNRSRRRGSWETINNTCGYMLTVVNIDIQEK